ncbi:GntR family transcriptional regulator [Lentibacillus saliphilus]|uniref:GntR family transcriptional regulator n=1 Tax=Lentibacillus saliphilus TaxID=2737028 RepID=UPI001C2F3B10|nr:GntR family transcriptional regulator [Lentibacillus saliphilus]
MTDFLKDNALGPIYKQVYIWMKKKMVSGEWNAGDQIPPEVVLSADLKVSRHTIRKALELLMNEGYLFRQPGKGTFVNQKKSNYELSYLTSFTEQMKALNRIPSSKIIDIKNNVVPDRQLKEKLALSEYERLIKIYRLRLADNEPMSLEEVYMNNKLAPDLHKKDLGCQSLYTILEEDYQLTIDRGDMILGAAAANQHQAELLNVREDSPLVYMECLTYLHHQRPAFLTFARYPYDRYIFSLNLTRNNS